MTWNLSQLEALLAKKDDWAVHLENNCLCITSEDGLDAYLAVSGEQIIVESILFAKSQVRNPVALNEQILKTHQVFPLSTICVNTVDGEDYYVAFGSLSSQSKEESVAIEVQTLFDNVSGFLDAYEEFLT